MSLKMGGKIIGGDMCDLLEELDDLYIRYDLYKDGIRVYTDIGTIEISVGMMPYVGYDDILYMIEFGFKVQ